MSKMCARCGVKEREISSYCRDCRNTMAREQYAKRVSDEGYRGKRNERCNNYYNEHQREYDRNYNLNKKYKINLEQYSSMYAAQSGMCAVCGVKRDVLDVDHNHVTGKVRALLCRQCNHALGLLRDDIENGKSLVRYLERYAE